MSETLIAELLRYCKTRYGIDLNESSGPRALLMAELCMLKAVVEAGRASMQRWCERLGDGFVGSRVTHRGVRLRFVGRREKAIHGLFGLITLARAYYAPVAGGGKGWVPLAERVGIHFQMSGAIGGVDLAHRDRPVQRDRSAGGVASPAYQPVYAAAEALEHVDPTAVGEVTVRARQPVFALVLGLSAGRYVVFHRARECRAALPAHFEHVSMVPGVPRGLRHAGRGPALDDAEAVAFAAVIRQNVDGGEGVRQAVDDVGPGLAVVTDFDRHVVVAADRGGRALGRSASMSYVRRDALISTDAAARTARDDITRAAA